MTLTLTSPYTIKDNRDKNSFSKKGFKVILGREMGRTHLPRRTLPFPILRHNSANKITHNLNNSHIVETFSSTGKINNLKSFARIKNLPNATYLDNHKFRSEQNVKGLQKYASEINNNNASKISVELIVLKENTNNKSLSKIAQNGVSGAKDNITNSLKFSDQTKIHQNKSQPIEKDDVFKKSVITLAKSISVIQNASYDNNGSEKNSLIESINEHLAQMEENKLDVGQSLFIPYNDLQPQYSSNQTLHSIVQNKHDPFDIQQVDKVSNYKSKESSKIKPSNDTIINEGSHIASQKIKTNFEPASSIKRLKETATINNIATNNSANRPRYSTIEYNNMSRKKLRKNQNIVTPAAILQINNADSNIIDFSRSDNYTKNTIKFSLDDKSEGSTLNYTGKTDVIRESNSSSTVTHIIKDNKNRNISELEHSSKKILRPQKTNKMPSRSNLYLKRFRECIQLGKRCRWS